MKIRRNVAVATIPSHHAPTNRGSVWVIPGSTIIMFQKLVIFDSQIKLHRPNGFSKNFKKNPETTKPRPEPMMRTAATVLR